MGARERTPTVYVPEGGSIIVEASGFQFVISNQDRAFCPAGEDFVAVRVMADIADDSGREKVLWATEMTPPGISRDQAEAAAHEMGDPPRAPMEMEHNQILADLPWVETPDVTLTYSPSQELAKIHDAATQAGLTLRTPVLDLDAAIAAAVNRTPNELGIIPGEPGIAGSERPPAGPVAPAPAAAPAQLSRGLEAAPEAPPPPAPPRRSLLPMEKAPRAGEYVMLEREDGQREMARWSSSFGRQFWVDPSGDSLGFDDSFSGWQVPTADEREEYDVGPPRGGDD